MVIHKKRILSVIITCFTLSQASQAETLRDVIATTVSTHPEIRIAAKLRSADNEQVAQAKANYFPTIDANAGYGKEKADNFNSNFITNTLWRTDLGINARQPLFDGFFARSEVMRTRAKTNGDAYRVWGTAEDQALSAVQAYLDVLRSRELVDIARKNYEVHTKTYSMVSHLSEQGLGREADTEQTSGRVDLAKANLLSAENNLHNAEINFQKVTGMEARHLAMPPEVPETDLPKNLEQALAVAYARHPTLRSASADIVQARGQYESSKSKFYPRFDVILNVLQSKNVGGSPGPDHDRLLMVQMNYNLMQGGKDIAHTRETAYQVQQATEIRNRAEYQVRDLMKLSWEALESSQSRIPLLKAHVHSSELTSASYGRQFQLGKRTILDVLDSQNEHYTALQDLTNEQYALMLARFRILNAEGRLIEFFNVPLPAEAAIPYTKC